MRTKDKLKDDEAFVADWLSPMLLKEMAVKYDVSPGTLRRKADTLNLGRKNCFPPDIELSGGKWVPNERGVMIWVEG